VNPEVEGAQAQRTTRSRLAGRVVAAVPGCTEAAIITVRAIHFSPGSGRDVERAAFTGEASVSLGAHLTAAKDELHSYAVHARKLLLRPGRSERLGPR
jgi:hypothetical protein